jgi:hypothetical protein
MRTTPLREHPLLISLVFIVFLSEPYWVVSSCQHFLQVNEFYSGSGSDKVN